MLFLTIFVVLAVAQFSYAQIPCDSEYGQFCAEESGFGVGECLKNHKTDLSADCTKYVEIMDTCKDDITKHCAGKEYTGDAQVCLTDWTKPEDLSEDCNKILPKKIVKERVLSAKEKAKAAKRRKIRKAAESMARNAGKNKKATKDEDDDEDDL